MKYLKKALMWAYGDSLRYIVFMALVAFAIALLQVFIVYPIQVLTTLVVGFIVVVLFMLVTEWK